jgi:DNA replicative helicase MCM subunit Mcm2 (Cdc46/Mcm family)
MNDGNRADGNDISALETLINESDTAWAVEDWSFRANKSEYGTLKLEVEWNPTAEIDRGDTRTAKDVIRDIEAEHEKGAPVQTVKRRLYEEHDMKEMEAAEVIEKLRTKGEVYEPQQGNLRTT